MLYMISKRALTKVSEGISKNTSRIYKGELKKGVGEDVGEAVSKNYLRALRRGIVKKDREIVKENDRETVSENVWEEMQYNTWKCWRVCEKDLSKAVTEKVKSGARKESSDGVVASFREYGTKGYHE